MIGTEALPTPPRGLQPQSLQPEIEGATKPLKTFKDCAPGFLQIDIKYLPQMPDETHRRCLFVAIDRATRWVYIRSYRDQSEQSSVDSASTPTCADR